MKPNSTINRPTRTRPAADEWERSWQLHWRKAGLPDYEPPLNGAAGLDRDFLNNTRTPQKERARLKRFNDAFERAFKALYSLSVCRCQHRVPIFFHSQGLPGEVLVRLHHHTGRVGHAG